MPQRNYLVSTTALSLSASGTTIGSGNTQSPTFVVALTLKRTGLSAGELLSGSQTWSIHYVVSAMSTPYEMRLKLQRLDSGGSVQSESSYGTTRSATGTYDDIITWDSGAWNGNDQLALIWEHRRPSGTGNKSGTINANGASYVDAPTPEETITPDMWYRPVHDLVRKAAGRIALLPALAFPFLPADVIDDYVGYWPMDDPTGSTVTDVSANANHGTATGTTIVDGKFAKARNFDGNADLATIPHSTPLNISTAITIACWIKMISLDTGGNNELLQKNGSYGLKVQADGKVQGYRWGGAESHASSTTIQPDVWYHVAMTYNGTVHRTYVNGSLESEENDSGSIPTTSNDVTVSGAGNRFEGLIDDLRIYGRALTQSEIQTLYNWTPPAPPETITLDKWAQPIVNPLPEYYDILGY
jgi:hypothetical protein